MNRLRPLAGTAAAVLGMAVLLGHPGGSPHQPHAVRLAGYVVAESGAVSDNGRAAAVQRAPFGITGQVIWPTGTMVQSFYPGATARLRLTISNPRPARALTVTSVIATVHRAGPGCGPGNLVAGTWRGAPLVIPPAGNATTTLSLKMLGSAPDACKNVTFPIALTGRGS